MTVLAFILTISDEEKMNANSKNWSNEQAGLHQNIHVIKLHTAGPVIL